MRERQDWEMKESGRSGPTAGTLGECTGGVHLPSQVCEKQQSLETTQRRPLVRVPPEDGRGRRVLGLLCFVLFFFSDVASDDRGGRAPPELPADGRLTGLRTQTSGCCH